MQLEITILVMVSIARTTYSLKNTKQKQYRQHADDEQEHVERHSVFILDSEKMAKIKTCLVLKS